MDQFTVYWNQPSSIWMKCDRCGELIEVNHGDTLFDIQQRVELHDRNNCE